MENKDKQLLLKTLCAGLPYGVIVQYTTGDYQHIDCGVDMVSIASECVGIFELGTTKVGWRGIEYVKPYLRPMSSMTEEEKKELKELCKEDLSEFAKFISTGHGLTRDGIYMFDKLRELDWLNKNHFDYRNLIPMGLALKAPEEMYKNE